MVELAAASVQNRVLASLRREIDTAQGDARPVIVAVATAEHTLPNEPSVAFGRPVTAAKSPWKSDMSGRRPKFCVGFIGLINPNDVANVTTVRTAIVPRVRGTTG